MIPVLFLCFVLVEILAEPHCPTMDNWKPVFFPDEDCTKFWECSNGSPYQLSCPPGLHFNPKINVCDWPDKSICDPINKPTTTTPQTVTDSVDSQDNEHVVPICSDNTNPNAYYVADGDCNKYWQCYNGQLFESSCPDGLHFNRVLSVCDWPENAGCETNSEIRTSPPSDAEEELETSEPIENASENQKTAEQLPTEYSPTQTKITQRPVVPTGFSDLLTIFPNFWPDMLPTQVPTGESDISADIEVSSAIPVQPASSTTKSTSALCTSTPTFTTTPKLTTTTTAAPMSTVTPDAATSTLAPTTTLKPSTNKPSVTDTEPPTTKVTPTNEYPSVAPEDHDSSSEVDGEPRNKPVPMQDHKSSEERAAARNNPASVPKEDENPSEETAPTMNNPPSDTTADEDSSKEKSAARNDPQSIPVQDHESSEEKAAARNNRPPGPVEDQQASEENAAAKNNPLPVPAQNKDSSKEKVTTRNIPPNVPVEHHESSKEETADRNNPHPVPVEDHESSKEKAAPRNIPQPAVVEDQVPEEQDFNRICQGFASIKLLPFPGNCRYFVQCIRQQARVRECPGKQFFNPSRNSCTSDRSACI